MFYSDVRGLPRNVKWPVELKSGGTHKTNSAFVTVFSKSDNELYAVRKDQLVPFPNAQLEKKGYAAFKRKPATMKCFKDDLIWATSMIDKLPVSSWKRKALDDHIGCETDCNKEHSSESGIDGVSSKKMKTLESNGIEIEGNTEPFSESDDDNDDDYVSENPFHTEESIARCQDNKFVFDHIGCETDCNKEHSSESGIDGVSSKKMKTLESNGIEIEGNTEPFSESDDDNDDDYVSENPFHTEESIARCQDNKFVFDHIGCETDCNKEHSSESGIDGVSSKKMKTLESNGIEIEGNTEPFSESDDDDDDYVSENPFHTEESIARCQDNKFVFDHIGCETDCNKEHSSESGIDGVSSKKMKTLESNGIEIEGNTEPFSESDDDNDDDYVSENPFHTEESIARCQDNKFVFDHIGCETDCNKEHSSESGIDGVSSKKMKTLESNGIEIEGNTEPFSESDDDNDDDYVSENPFHTEESIARCQDNKFVFVKRVTKSDTTREGVKKKSDRQYTSYHSCPFCSDDKMFSNFAQHVQRRHKDEVEVKAFMAEDDQNKKKRLIAQLRRRADNSHNILVEKKCKGEIILGRRFDKGTFRLRDYGPCPRCLEWLKKVGFQRHLKNCCAQLSSRDSQSCLVIQSDVMCGRIIPTASPSLLNEVFSIMKNDEVGLVAQSDPLIITIGNRWMEKLHGNVINRKYYTSSVMRLVSRYYMELQKTQVPSLTMQSKSALSDYLRPQFFDINIQAALSCASQNLDNLEDLASPSNAIKLGYEIKRLCSAKLGYAIRERNQLDKVECEDFLKLVEIEWGTRVTKLARVLLNERKFNEEKHLPQPEDINKMRNHLNQCLKEVSYEKTYSNYRRTCIMVQAKLLSFNRRRPGEIEQLKLKSYQRRVIGTSAIDIEMTRELTKWEKHLLTSQEVVETRGKTGRGVPIIIPAEAKKSLQFITDVVVREAVGIRSENPFVFASSNLGVFRAYDSLVKITTECQLKAPEKITSTNLRKYCATVSQVLNMTTSQLDWVCEHLGHSTDVHKDHYRARSDVIERVEIAKLLLMQDLGCTKKFVGKRLEDVQFEDLVNSEESEQPTESSVSASNAPGENSVFEETECPVPGFNVYRFIESDDENEDIRCLENPKKPKKRNLVVRHKWTTKEEAELKSFLKRNFRNMKCPTQSECDSAKKASKESGGEIWKIPRDNIKKKVSNMLKKIQADR